MKNFLKSNWRNFLTVTLFIVGGILLGIRTNPNYASLGAAYGAAGGAVLGLSMLGYRKLVTKLGRFTAIAAMSCLWGGFFLAAAYFSPTCPGSSYAGVECSTTETGAWLLSGILLPVVWAVLIMPPVGFVKLVRRIIQKFRNNKTAKKTTSHTPLASKDAASIQEAKVKKVSRKIAKSSRKQNRV